MTLWLICGSKIQVNQRLTVLILWSRNQTLESCVQPRSTGALISFACSPIKIVVLQGKLVHAYNSIILIGPEPPPRDHHRRPPPRTTATRPPPRDHRHGTTTTATRDHHHHRRHGYCHHYQRSTTTTGPPRDHHHAVGPPRRTPRDHGPPPRDHHHGHSGKPPKTPAFQPQPLSTPKPPTTPDRTQTIAAKAKKQNPPQNTTKLRTQTLYNFY